MTVTSKVLLLNSLLIENNTNTPHKNLTANLGDFLQNLTVLNSTAIEDDTSLYPLPLVIPITVVYAVIFITGVVGNVSTCTVISRNKSMHTATNYYLFSLAISDMLLLISGLPPEMYRIWSPETYLFGEAFCFIQGFAAETSANATVLTITAFTVERYLAICHPFLSHTMSKLSRAIRYIIAIWILALCLAVPQAIQFGVDYELKNGVVHSRCTVVSDYFAHAFEISTFLFFVGPMTLITVLYVLIAIQLRKSRNISVPKRPSTTSTGTENGKNSRSLAAQNRVVKMLVAVVAAFFICWAPFHAQRLLAVYLSNSADQASETTITIYMILMHSSGILYYISTTINPVLYHIMSNKFREAFKKTLTDFCWKKSQHKRNYAALSRYTQNGPNCRRSLSDDNNKAANETLIDINIENKNNTNGSNNQNNRALTHSSQNNIDKKIAKKFNRPSNTSESSETTILSTVSNQISNNNVVTRHVPLHRTIDSHAMENGSGSTLNKAPTNLTCPKNQQINQNNKYLGAITNKMRRLFQNGNRNYVTSNNNKKTFFRQTSIGSATISNSSLQDLDEIEFSSSDLVKFMEEINDNLNVT